MFVQALNAFPVGLVDWGSVGFVEADLARGFVEVASYYDLAVFCRLQLGHDRSGSKFILCQFLLSFLNFDQFSLLLGSQQLNFLKSGAKQALLQLVRLDVAVDCQVRYHRQLHRERDRVQGSRHQRQTSA